MSRYFDEYDYDDYEYYDEPDFDPPYDAENDEYVEDDYEDRFADRFKPYYVEQYDSDDTEDNMWANIPGHPNHQINIYGQVRHKRKKNILKPFPDRYGYLRLSLGNVDNIPIHRIMCETFYGEPREERAQVNHKDCNRQNNNILNLEWCTPSENIKWGVKHGNIDPMKGLRRATEVNVKPVRIVETDQVFCSIKDCADYLGVSAQSVGRVVRSENKKYTVHGFHVEYVSKKEV